MSLPLPKLSRAKRGRQNGDPPNSEFSRGKSRSMQKSARDGGWTPTEQRKRDQLMRQFCKLESGAGLGNSEAYRSSSIWCRHPGCKRMNGTHGHD